MNNFRLIRCFEQIAHNNNNKESTYCGILGTEQRDRLAKETIQEENWNNIVLNKGMENIIKLRNNVNWQNEIYHQKKIIWIDDVQILRLKD